MSRQERLVDRSMGYVSIATNTNAVQEGSNIVRRHPTKIQGQANQ